MECLRQGGEIDPPEEEMAVEQCGKRLAELELQDQQPEISS